MNDAGNKTTWSTIWATVCLGLGMDPRRLMVFREVLLRPDARRVPAVHATL